MKNPKNLLWLLSLILLIGIAVFYILDRSAQNEDSPAQSQNSPQDELETESPANPEPLSDSDLSADDLNATAASDDTPSPLLPSQVVGRVFPKVDMDALAFRLPGEKFAIYERTRLEFPEVDWTEIEPTHLAFLAKRDEFPLNLNDNQREAYAAWLAEVEPMSRALVKLRAEAHGLSYGGMENDRGYYIDGFRNGEPDYVFSANVGAATTTGVSYVRWNPGFDPALGDTINGGEFYVNVNDHGEIHEHTEFQLPDGGGSRIMVKQVPSYENGDRNHMTHVAGTMTAWGYSSNLQGMAPRAWIRSLIQQSTNHITTYGMATPGQQMGIINPRTGNLQLRSVVGNTSLGGAVFNRYTATSASYDTVLRDYPYYMHFYSSGNSGAGGYETLTGASKIAKNMIVIGNVTAATRNADGVYTGGGNISGSSSRGPTYDGRISPDFVGKGVSVLSTVNANGSSTSNGTSMSSPNVAGSVALLMDYVRQRLPQQYLRTSTYRALLATTADDRGNPGPDYIYGWGILNIHAAAKIVREQADNPSQRLIIEDSLAPNQTWTETYASDGSEPIRVTIAWLDPASTNTDSNSRASRIVNDLDLRLIGPGGTEHRPYVMPFTTGQGETPAFSSTLYNAHAVQGDNTTDPVEQVYIAAPAAGLYTVQVTHKGNLRNNQAQPFSVAVSGLNSDFDPSMEVVRNGSPINVGAADGVSGTSVGSGTQLTYTISNVGGAQLELTTPVTISNPQNCSVTVNTQPSSPVDGGESTNLVTTVTPASGGTWSFNISIANNDPEKDPYHWHVTGIAGSAAPVSFTPVADTYINNQSAGSNYGEETRMNLNNRTNGANQSVQRGLVRFDLSSIPPGAVIESATLDFVQDNANSGPINIVEATASWEETNATWSDHNGIYGSTSFGSASTGSTAGAAVPTITLNAAGLAKVQNWVDSPSGNHGFGITTTNNGNGEASWLALRTREHPTAAHHPRLTVTYGGGGAVEAPLMIVSGNNGVVSNGGIDSVTSTQLTYTIANLGNANLTLTTPVTATALTNCSITVSTQPSGTVAPSASTDLVLTVTPSIAGSWSATVSIANSDADKTPYSWTINGSVAFNQTVTYNGNSNDSGTAPVDPVSPYFDGAVVTVLAPGTLAKTGHTFAGWNTAANGTGTSYAPSDTFTISIPTTLFAQWTPNSYTVTFDSNGGDAPTPSTKQVTFNSPYGTLATAIRTGHSFNGWFTAPTGGTQVTAATIVTSTENHTLYAQWIAGNNGTWLTTAAGSFNWIDSNNWVDGIIANGTDATAFFAANITGNQTVSLDAPRTIGNIITSNTANNYTLSGSSILTLSRSSGLPVIDVQTNRILTIDNRISSSTGFQKDGIGRLILTHNSSSWAGSTTVVNGMLDLREIPVANIGGGSGRNITIEAGAAVRRQFLNNAFLNRIVETEEEITVMTGPGGPTPNTNNLNFSSSTGANLPNAFLGNWASNGAKLEYTGIITPAADYYRLGGTLSSGLLGMRRVLTGSQGLIVGGTGAGGIRVNLVAANTFTGNTIINLGAKLTLGNNLALQNSALDLDSSGGNFALASGTQEARITGETAASSPTFGGLIGSRNLLEAFTNAGGNNESNLASTAVTGFTLNLGSGKNLEYTGAIANFAPATTLTKTGPGIQILAGTNTYTGATTVSDGKLFINGSLSNVDAALTVAPGATLGGTGTVGRNVTIESGGKLEFDLSSNVAGHDPLNISTGRSFAFSGTSELTITTTGGAAPGTYTLVTGGGNLTGSAPATLNLPEDWVATTEISGNSLLLNVISVNSLPTYTVSYNGNGNTSGTAPADQIKEEDVNLILSGPGTLERTGYSFTGWNTAANGSGTAYPAEATYTANAPLTLFAQWSANTYTVTFDPKGGGTPSPTSIEVTFDSSYGTMATVSRTGYTFSGWFTDPTGGTEITAATTVATASNHTLYAQWTASTYTVTFDPNGGGAPSSTNIEVTFDSAYGTLATVSRTGYTFTGWFTAAIGGSEITAATPVATAGNHTLFAQWTLDVVSVVTDVNTVNIPEGGTETFQVKLSNQPAENVTVTVSRTSGDTDITVQSGGSLSFTTSNWDAYQTVTLAAANDDDAENGSATITCEPSDPAYTAAQVTANEIDKDTTLTVASGGNGSTDPDGAVIVEKDTATAISATPSEGYDFVNWSVTSGSATLADADAASTTATISEPATVQANFEIKTYTVSYNGNANTSGAAPADQTKTHAVDLTLATNTGNLTNIGYTFTGWNTQADGSGQDYAEGATYTANASLTLYAKWTVNTYDVAFNANGGTAADPASKQVTFDSAYGALSTTSRTGHAFNGWFTAAEGGTEITAETLVAIAENHTLYAQWTPDTYTVTYNGNENTSGTPPADQEKVHDVDLTLASNTGNLVKTGFSFAGWNTTADGTGTDYPAGALYTENTPLTLYAKWTPGADGTWLQTAAGPFNWGENANWTGGIVASGADATAFFTPNITEAQTVNLESSRTIGNIAFTDSTSSSHDLTISGESILTLSRSEGLPRIDVTQPNRTLAISSGISGSDGIEKHGPGNLSITGINSFTGGVILNDGRLQIDANENLGSAENGVTFTESAGLLLATNTVNGAQSIDFGARTFTANTGVMGVLGMPNKNGNHVFTFGGQFTGEGGFQMSHGYQLGSATFHLNHHHNDFHGSLRMGGDYAGNNQFVPGTLTVNLASLADGVGYGNIEFGRVQNNTRNIYLNYTNAAASDLVLNHRRIDLDTVGSSHIVNNNTTYGFIINTDLLVSQAGNKKLVLNAVADSTNNVFAGDIDDGTNAVITIEKTGAGAWALGGTNSYSGITNLVANGTTGRLIFQGAQSLSPNTSIAFNQNSSNVQSISLLDDGEGIIDFARAITFAGANTTQAMNIFVGNNNTANGGSSASSTTTGSTIQAGSITITPTHPGVNSTSLNATGANDYQLATGLITLGNAALKTSGTYTTILNPTTAALKVAGITMADGANGLVVPHLHLGGTATGNFVDGVISDATDALTTGIPLNVSKVGTSDWILSGDNTYTGNTTVGAGKLFINGNQSAAIGDVSVAANATLGGSGIIGGNTTIANNGGLEFDLSTPAVSHVPLDLASGRTFTFSGASVLTITSNGGAIPGTYTLVTAPGGITGNAPATVTLPEDWEATVQIDGNDLVLNVTSVGAGGPGPVASFAITGIPAQVPVGSEVTGITITALDAGAEVATSFTGNVTYGGTAGITGTSASFVNGVLENVSITPMIIGPGLTFTVDDGGGHTGSATFSVVGTPYNDWAAANGLIGASADPDAILLGDGLTNLQKFAFGMDPAISSTANVALDENGNATGGMPSVMHVGTTATSVDFRAVFARRKDYQAAGVSYSVQFSAGLDVWVTSDTPPTVMSNPDQPGDIEAVYIPYPLFIQTDFGLQKPRFFRVGVSMD